MYKSYIGGKDYDWYSLGIYDRSFAIIIVTACLALKTIVGNQ